MSGDNRDTNEQRPQGSPAAEKNLMTTPNNPDNRNESTRRAEVTPTPTEPSRHMSTDEHRELSQAVSAHLEPHSRTPPSITNWKINPHALNRFSDLGIARQPAAIKIFMDRLNSGFHRINLQLARLNAGYNKMRDLLTNTLSNHSISLKSEAASTSRKDAAKKLFADATGECDPNRRMETMETEMGQASTAITNALDDRIGPVIDRLDEHMARRDDGFNEMQKLVNRTLSDHGIWQKIRSWVDHAVKLRAEPLQKLVTDSKAEKDEALRRMDIMKTEMDKMTAVRKRDETLQLEVDGLRKDHDGLRKDVMNLLKALQELKATFEQAENNRDIKQNELERAIAKSYHDVYEELNKMAESEFDNDAYETRDEWYETREFVEPTPVVRGPIRWIYNTAVARGPAAAAAAAATDGNAAGTDNAAAGGGGGDNGGGQAPQAGQAHQAAQTSQAG